MAVKDINQLRLDFKMKKLAATFVALALLSGFALAESPYCMPTRDGKHSFPKTGKHCPTDYTSSGRCCVAIHADTPRAFPKIDGVACPTVTLRRRPPCTIAFRVADCRYGYRY